MQICLLCVVVTLAVFFNAILVDGKTCKRNFGGCDKSQGLCWNTNEGSNSYCTCKSGYRFRIPSLRLGSCVDINECKAKLDSCDRKHGRCVNTIGSHRCVCKRGYVLDYTNTDCLKASKIKGICEHRKYSLRRFRYRNDDDYVKFFLRMFKKTSGSNERKCESGYELRGGCEYCQDINECKRRSSKCDLRKGYCHNSDGGYYCTCIVGYVLGPCRLKCYRSSDRPKRCSSTIFSSLDILKNKIGLINEVPKAVMLDILTEKNAESRKMKIFNTLVYSPCTKVGKQRTQKFDIDGNKKYDVFINYLCSTDKILVVKSVFYKEAKWDQWTSWTICKPTCSGGIQTRTRTCKHGLVGEGKCGGSATRYKTCYTGKHCKLRVRREVNSLTKRQKKDLRQAMIKYKEDTSNFGYHNAAGSHIFPKQCTGVNGKAEGCCYHGAKLNFVMWHRAELLNFEEGLSRHLKDKTIGLPYWDWLKYPNPPAFIWSKKIRGKENPFASSIARYDTNPQTETVRSKKVDHTTVKRAQTIYMNTTLSLMRSNTIHEFSQSLESSHNNIHAAICHGKTNCTFSMASLAYAAFDPIFFMHHANVDRLFAVFHSLMEKNNDLAWTRQSVLEPQENIYHFNEPFQPFMNTTLNPFKRLHALSTIENLFYYQQMLGYKYDTLSTMPTAGLVREKQFSHNVPTSDKLLIAQFEKSLHSNVKISYYVSHKLIGVPDLQPCIQLEEEDGRFVGSITILGTQNERTWESRQATFVNINDILFSRSTAIGNVMLKSGLSARNKIKIKACYTHDMQCTSKCSQVAEKTKKFIPSPQLVLHPQNIRTDIVEFEWNLKRTRMPTWLIDIHSGSEWIVFWGPEAKNIVQVTSFANYQSCNTNGAVRITCSTACILPNGIHYFIHKDETLCKSGLKLSLMASI